MSDRPADGPRPLVEIVAGLLAAAWRRRYAIVLPMLLLPVIGGFVGTMAPRTYETRMSILIQEPGKINPFLEDLSVKTNLKERMEALKALLTSRHVLVDVARDIGLIEADTPSRRVDDVVFGLASNVSVSLVGAELVELKYRAGQPQGMDRVLASIGRHFLERVEAPEDSSIRVSEEFLSGQLRDASQRLAVAERALSDFKSRNAQQMPDLRAGNVQRLASLRDELAQRQTELAGAEAQLASVRQRLAETDPVIGRLEQDIVSTRSELAVLRSRYTDEHSKVQAAERKLQRLEDERGEQLRAAANVPPMDTDRVVNLAAVAAMRGDGSQPLLVSQAALMQAARVKVDELRSEVVNLQKSIDELTSRIANAGEVERELAGLDREVKVAAELQEQLRKRYDMAKVTGELSRHQQPTRVAVIDRPFVPTQPTKPVTLLFTVGGLVGGLVLGIGLAAMLEIGDTTIRTARAMQRLTGVPVLARIMPLDRPMERRWGA